MIDFKKNLKQAINYNLVLELIGYSSKIFYQNFDELQDFIFIDDFAINNLNKFALFFKKSSPEIETIFYKVKKQFDANDLDYSILTVKDDLYPELLKKTSHPPLFLFTRGNLDFFNTPAISVVGSRKPTPEGVKRAQKLSFLLVKEGYTVVSGLATGIDTAAHSATVQAGGRTIAVIGTPINKYYPKENQFLQEKIAADHLLVSQFPIAHLINPYNFPARNYTMCGLTYATVIVEAGETSGALYQARFCLQEGRKLFILKSLLENPVLKWPHEYKKRGAIVIDDIDTVTKELRSYKPINSNTEERKEIIQQQITLFDQEIQE